MAKYKLFDKSTNTAPQAFYDEARFLMNQWNKQNKSEQPMYPMGHIPLKKKTNKKQRKRKKKKISPNPAVQEQKMPISNSIIITIQTDSNKKHTLKHKFTKTDTILCVKKVISSELNMTFGTINLYHMTMDCLFENDKTLKYYRIADTYEMRHVPPSPSIIKDDDSKEELSKREKVKIDKDTFIKTSKTKKNHYATFPTLSTYSNASSNDDEKVAGLTKEILSKEPSGDPKQKDTLLHILDGAAKLNGKRCVFFDSSKGIRSDLAENSYLNAIDANTQDSAKFVVTLNTLDQFVDKEEEKTYDGADKLVEIKESLANKTYNPIVDDIRSKLAAAHEVPADRIVIKDVYLNGVGIAYYVKDLTDSEKNNIIIKDSGLQTKMQKLFADYDKCAIHPALFESSYDISMFDKLGNKTFADSDNGKYKVGPPGKEREYTQPSGWTRYGLKVLGKYGDDKWLHPFNDAGNWWRAFHGTKNAAVYNVNPADAMANIHNNGFQPAINAAYGPGVYCSPKPPTAEGYAHITPMNIRGNNGQLVQKNFKFMLQVAVKPGPNTLTPLSDNNVWSVINKHDIR
eukprot:869677_1